MLKKLIISIAIFASCALLLTACGGSSNTSNGNANSVATDNANKASTTGTPAPAASPASTTSKTSGEKIGIPECDDYLARYEACVSGYVPEAARAQYNASLDTLRTSWRQMAADPKTKAGLAKTCEIATERAKQDFKMFRCEF
jgi:predicted small secreted protein